MDSDLPLIEIAGEDDSLLQQLPDLNETTSKSSVDYFTFSPLHLPLSHTKSLKGSMDIEKRSSSSSKDSNNKENMNLHNLEVPKLGLEPMQMKRRKRGGGYNLRKSLAWDRAFFTDEGILDPLELSMVTGINGNTCGERLAAISEEGNHSFSVDTKHTNDSEERQAFEEASLKELPDKSHTLKGKKEKAGCSVGKHGLPHDRVTRKVLSVHGPNRDGSKIDGCPGPIAASSSKRPVISNAVKTAKQESKLPKLPVSKPGPCISATAKGSVIASQVRHNLIPKPTLNVQKNVGLKNSVKSAIVSQSKGKMGPGCLRLPAKNPAQNAVRNLTDISSKANSSTKSRSVQIGQANSGLEIIRDRLQICEIQEESAPLSAKDLGQHTATNLTNALPEAAGLTNSGLQRASGQLMISDKLQSLHPCESQVDSAAHATSRCRNLSTTGTCPPEIEPAKPSGLRLPSPSLRFFDQKIALESSSIFQKNAQQYNTNLDSNIKLGEHRPPTIPGRTPIKGIDITESVFSGVLTSSRQCSAPSTIGAHYDSTHLSPSPNYMGSIISAVSDLKINRDLEIKNVQKVDMNIQYECSSSEQKAHEVIEQEQKILRQVENIEMEKTAWKCDGKVKVGGDNQVHLESRPTEQLAEGNGVIINLAENVGDNKVGVGTLELMAQDKDERVALVPGIRDKLVHQSNKDKLQNYSALSKSMPGKSVQNYLTTVDSSREFMQELTQTSREQVDTEKIDIPEVDPGSHFYGSFVGTKDQVSTVSLESQKDGNRKVADDLRAPKDAGPGKKSYHLVLHPGKIEQENYVANGVDEIYTRLSVGVDTGCHTDTCCPETKGGLSIICAESLKDEIGNIGNVDARELKCTGTTLCNFPIPFQITDTEQGKNDADSVDAFSSRSPMRDAITQAVHDNLSAEGGFHTDPNASIKKNDQLEDSGISDRAAKCTEATTPCLSVVLNSQSHCEGWSVDCIVPAESSSLEKSSCDNATESIDYVVQERRLDDLSAIYMEVPVQTQDGVVDVDLIPEPHTEALVESREFAPLVGDHNHSSHPHLRPEVELISGTTSAGGDAYLEADTVLQVAQRACTGLKSSTMEGLDLSVVTREIEFQTDEESSQKSWERWVSSRSLSEKSTVIEESEYSLCNILDANPTVQGCIGGLETSNSQFLNACQTLEDAGAADHSCKSDVKDAQGQLLDGDTVVESFSKFTSVVHDHSLQHVDHSDIFEQPESFNTGIQVEQSEVHECDPKGSKIIVHAPPLAQEVDFDCDGDGQPCLENATSGSAVVVSIIVQGCIDGLETSDSQFLSACQTLEDAGAVDHFCKSDVEDAQVQLLDGDTVVKSCSKFTSVVHDHSLQHVDHSDIFEQPESSNTGIQVEQSEVLECDPKGSNIIVHAPPLAQEVDFDCDGDRQLCLENATSGSAVVDSITVQGCIDRLETSDSQFLSACQTLEAAGAVDHFCKSDAQVHLLNGDTIVESCSKFTSDSVVHYHSLQHVDHSDIFEQPESLNTGIQIEQSVVHECDLKRSKIIVHAPPLAQEVDFDCDGDGQLCLGNAISGSAVVDSIAEHEESYNDRRLARNIECFALSPYPEIESEGKDQTVGVNTTCMDYCSVAEESCSYPRKVDVSMLEEMPTVYQPFLDIERVMTDSHQLRMDTLSPEKIVNLEKSDNALDSAILIRNPSTNHGSDLESSNASAQITPTVHENVFDLVGGDWPYMDNEPQSFVGIMPSVETHEYFTYGQTEHGLKSTGQGPSEFNSISPVNQHPAIGANTKSTTFCSVTEESCSVTAELCVVGGGKSLPTSSEFRIGADGSKKDLGEEAEFKNCEGNSPTVGDFHHELDSGSGLKTDENATVLIKRSNNIVRQDNTLVIHPPNAVPFSDEWLAAMEAAGEEILTMKCGAVQHSPPDKSVPEPGPWSPVKKKANQIGPYDCTKYTNTTMPLSPK